MMFPRITLIALSMCLNHSALGFSVSPAAVVLQNRPICVFRDSSTCLFAEETEQEAEPAPTTENDAAGKDTWTPSNDILNSPAFLKRKLEVIKSDIAKVEEDIVTAKAQLEEGKAEWASQFDALEVEFQNIQNRFSRQGSKGDEDAILNVSREMLNVLDNYDRAFKTVIAETEDEKAIEALYKQSYDNILNILKELGVTEIETVGKEFDYEFHQAVMQRAHEDYEEGIVCEELQKGFVLNGKRLVRAAMVTVAA